MSIPTINYPKTPHPKLSNHKAIPSELQRQCWTLPPPDRSISIQVLDCSDPAAPVSSSRRASTTGSLIMNKLSANTLLPDNRTWNVHTDSLSPNHVLQQSQTLLAIRLMRDSERKELDKTDVFSPKNPTRKPLANVATSPVRNSQPLNDPTSPFVKCLLSNTPAKLPTKISVMSPATYGYDNPPKLRRLSIQGDSIEEFRQRQSQEGHSIEKQDPHAPIEKSTRPLPNVQGEVEFEVISSPVSPLRDRDLLFIPEEPEEELTIKPHSDDLLSSPIRNIDVEDPFMSNKRQKVSN